MGQEHEYYYDVDDFYTPISTGRGLWKLSLYNPFYVTTVACFFSGIFLVPILYGKIYR